jgi:predicted nucleic acid-binding protein
VIVVDTNVLVYFVLPGEHSRSAERLVERDSEWHAPTLWRSEFRNVLAHYLRRGLLRVEEATDAFRAAESAVAGREFAVETGRVLELVERSTCSAYDCEFVALAEELGCQLVTGDRRILKEFPRTAVSIAGFDLRPSD